MQASALWVESQPYIRLDKFIIIIIIIIIIIMFLVYFFCYLRLYVMFFL